MGLISRRAHPYTVNMKDTDTHYVVRLLLCESTLSFDQSTHTMALPLDRHVAECCSSRTNVLRRGPKRGEMGRKSAGGLGARGY